MKGGQRGGGRGNFWRHVRPKSSVSHRRRVGQRPHSPCELQRCAEFSDPVSNFFFSFRLRFETSALPIECQEPAALQPDEWSGVAGGGACQSFFGHCVSFVCYCKLLIQKVKEI